MPNPNESVTVSKNLSPWELNKHQVSSMPTCPKPTSLEPVVILDTRKIGVALLRPSIRSRASAPVIVYGLESNRWRFAVLCKSVAFHFFPVSSLLVSLFYSSAGSCCGSGPCALAHVTANHMLNLSLRSKPAALVVRSTFLSDSSLFLYGIRKEQLIVRFVLSILGMDFYISFGHV